MKTEEQEIIEEGERIPTHDPKVNGTVTHNDHTYRLTEDAYYVGLLPGETYPSGSTFVEVGDYYAAAALDQQDKECTVFFRVFRVADDEEDCCDWDIASEIMYCDGDTWVDMKIKRTARKLTDQQKLARNAKRKAKRHAQERNCVIIRAFPVDSNGKEIKYQ